MRSRYSAFATKQTHYLIKTTHPHNQDFTDDTVSWSNSLDRYCASEAFLGLKILDFIDGEEEAFVTFEARLSDGVLHEKSRFLKEKGRWLYVDGEVVFTPSAR